MTRFCVNDTSLSNDAPQGTPPGVAFGMKPEPQWLKVGDVVEMGIEGLGVQRQRVVAFKA